MLWRTVAGIIRVERKDLPYESRRDCGMTKEIVVAMVVVVEVLVGDEME